MLAINSVMGTFRNDNGTTQEQSVCFENDRYLDSYLNRHLCRADFADSRARFEQTDCAFIGTGHYYLFSCYSTIRSIAQSTINSVTYAPFPIKNADDTILYVGVFYSLEERPLHWTANSEKRPHARTVSQRPMHSCENPTLFVNELLVLWLFCNDSG